MMGKPMTPKRRRMMFVMTGLVCLGAGVALILNALGSSLVYFYSPTDLQAKQVADGQRFRLGGLVETGSVSSQGATVHFTVTDTVNSVPVQFTGVLPDLFREGQGIVAEGSLDGAGTFKASDVLAKHDENYMPKEVADAIKAAGEWRPAETTGAQAATN